MINVEWGAIQDNHEDMDSHEDKSIIIWKNKTKIKYSSSRKSKFKKK